MTKNAIVPYGAFFFQDLDSCHVARGKSWKNFLTIPTPTSLYPSLIIIMRQKYIFESRKPKNLRFFNLPLSYLLYARLRWRGAFNEFYEEMLYSLQTFFFILFFCPIWKTSKLSSSEHMKINWFPVISCHEMLFAVVRHDKEHFVSILFSVLSLSLTC